MPKYNVMAEVRVRVLCEVEADDEDEALDNALHNLYKEYTVDDVEYYEVNEVDVD